MKALEILVDKVEIIGVDINGRTRTKPFPYEVYCLEINIAMPIQIDREEASRLVDSIYDASLRATNIIYNGCYIRKEDVKKLKL